MASFQAKIRGEMLRKGENKNYRHVPFQPDAQQKIPKKIGKNFKKIKKQIEKQVEKGQERRKTKIIVPFCSYPTHNRKY